MVYKRSLKIAELLTTPHRVDRYLELLSPMVTLQEMRAEVTDVRRAGSSTMLTLRPTRQWEGFDAGQFVRIGVVIDGVRQTRCYSPTGSAHDRARRIELTVKAHPGGLVSNYLHQHAEPGMVVDLAQADGDFRLPVHRPDGVLLISAGSGITPVLSMLRTLTSEGYSGDIAFLHYATGPDEVAHRDELLELATTYPNVTVALGYPSSGGGDLDGRFGLDHLESAAPWYRKAHTYVCGPAGLMDSVRSTFEDLGIVDRLYVEAFTLTPVVVDGPVEGTVSFTKSEVTAPNSGAPLLQQAEAAGLTPASGCRMGICFSCTAIKKSGCTRDLRTGEVSSDPDQRIQLCINAPVGDVAVEV